MCAEHRLWFHVDAAYGGAALCVPELAGRFAGIERADSLVIDPHKWLFAPLDCAAAALPRPGRRGRTHRQQAAYLDAFGDEHVNPSDLAFHLTRRARGLPFWFALVVHGTDAFTAAVRAGFELARPRGRLIDDARSAAAPRHGARALGRAVRARRLGGGRLGRLGSSCARRRAGLRHADLLAGAAVGRLAFLHPTDPVDTVVELLRRTHE